MGNPCSVTVIAGRYELGRGLGSGGMSDVWLAQDLLLGRQVAVKVFRPGLEPARVSQEVRLHAGLSHPGLVAAYDSGTDERGRTFLVLQLVDGPTLAERLRRRPMCAAEVTAVGAGVADALAHLHARGVVHRDVKPANILLDAAGQPHLTDLGIAQEAGQDGLTATGFTLGTVPYLSPEQVRGRGATPASDVYALGLVLLEALTGRREYPGMTAEGALARLTRRPLLDAHLVDPWPALLAAMTADEPGDRPTAADVAAALRGQEDVATAPDPVPDTVAVPLQDPVEPSAQGRRRGLAAVAVVLLVAGGLALPALTGGSGAPPAGPETAVEPSLQPVAVVTPSPSAAAPVAVPARTPTRPPVRTSPAATAAATTAKATTAKPKAPKGRAADKQHGKQRKSG